MHDTPDAELLERFARSESEEAFAELVRRHIALVHSVALRHTENPQHAQEITQAVFIILSRKAASLGRKTVLSGWLYHTARLTAANFRRAESRRVSREQEAYMQSTLAEPSSDTIWLELAPHLDDAMEKLGATDRDAVVLRYFENKSLTEVGTALGMEERAAQKRVNRALEKLRKIFSKRGVTLTATLIASAVAANSVQAAPVGLAAAVTAAAAKGAVVGSSTMVLVKGALKLMAWTKAKTAILVGVAILLPSTVGLYIATKAVISKEHEVIFQKPFWTSAELLEKSQSAMIIRPHLGDQTIGGFSLPNGKCVWVNGTVRDLVALAYDWDRDRILMPTDLSDGQSNQGYDYLNSLPAGQDVALRKELRKQFGISAHKETRETEVHHLRVLRRRDGRGCADGGAPHRQTADRAWRPKPRRPDREFRALDPRSRAAGQDRVRPLRYR